VSQTQHFGFEKFGSEGRISNNGHKFSLKDRDTLDVLLFKLFNHDHKDTSDFGPLEGPNFPVETTATAGGGTLGAGTALFYKISYIDFEGSETVASPATIVSTPNPISPPPVMLLDTSTTGGTLDPGTYKYSLAYYQSSGGVTRATNISSIVVPTGSTNNTITISLDTLPEGADGWRIYRKAPGEIQYYFLTAVASGATEYVDDGSVAPDCNLLRPNSNTTNASNSVTISINPNDLPLDPRVSAWRIYRSNNSDFGERSLIATATETTTQQGSTLVTTYLDTGDVTVQGQPLNQTTVPPNIPQLDAGDSFSLTGKPLAPELAPRGVSTWNTNINGTVSAATVNQTIPPFDMYVKRIDVFFQTAPTGVDGSNYVTIRVGDDSSVDEVQHVWTDAEPTNEIQNISNNATSGTFTLSFDGQGPTNPLDYNCPIETSSHQQSLYNNATGGTFTLSDGTNTTSAINYNDSAATIETRLETDIAAITDVSVTGGGTVGNPWIITWLDPLGPVNELTVNDSLTGGSSTITTVDVGQHGIKTELEALSNIVDLFVSGSGHAFDPWIIEFNDPGGQDVATITSDDTNLVGGTTTITTALNGSDGGTFTITDGTDTTAPIEWDAAAATVETRLQTDLTSVVDVSVTGTGTLADPWVITWVDPANTDVPQLQADSFGLSPEAAAYVETVVEGRSPTQIDVVANSGGQFFSWTSPTTDSGTQEAEIPPATGGTIVDDGYAANDAAVELDTQNEESYWNVGTLDPGDYVAYFYVSDFDSSATFVCSVVDDHLGTPSTLASSTFTPVRPSYIPAYEVKFTSTGTEDIFLVVEKTDAGAGAVRIDRYEYEVDLPRLYAGQNATVEALITGSPSTNGDDVQVTVWF
jgi:hypothetical protein